MTVAAVWNLADIFNGLMAFPNLVALVLFKQSCQQGNKTLFLIQNSIS